MPVFWIRIRIHRIHMFLGLPDPDPLVRSMDPDLTTDPSIMEKSKKKLDSYCFVTSFGLFIFEPTKSNKQKNCFKKTLFCWRFEGQ
jgi:hypothetical protein